MFEILFFIFCFAASKAIGLLLTRLKGIYLFIFVTSSTLEWQWPKVGISKLCPRIDVFVLPQVAQISDKEQILAF